jgi:hypothetical protein
MEISSLSGKKAMILVFGGVLSLVVLAILGIMLWGAFANFYHVSVRTWHFIRDLIEG